MDVDLTPEQQEFRAACRKLLEAECPISLVRALSADDSDGHSDVLWKALADMGWLGLPFGAEHGGSGATLEELGLAYAEAGRALLPTTLSSTIHAALLIDRMGTPTQVEEWLPKIVAGDVVATVAFAEPSVATSSQHLTATAVRNSAGWSLTGTKTFVPNAARADLLVIACKEMVSGGLALFLVPQGTDGVALTAHRTFSHDPQHIVELTGVALPDSSQLGGEPAPGVTERIYDDVLDAVTALQCMEMIGGAEKVLEITCDYVKGRFQFGVPIGSFQAVQHIVANIGMSLRGGRVAAHRALSTVACGRPAAKEVSVAKAWLSQAYPAATVWAHQVHGGMGYVRESDLHLWSQRAKTLEIQGGDREHHLRRIASIVLDG